MRRVLWSATLSCAVLALACPGAKGDKGDQGPPGAEGPQGTTGNTGPAGVFTGTFNGPSTFNGSATFTDDAGFSGNVDVAGAVVRTGPSGRISVNGIYCGKSASPTTGNLQFNSLVGYRAAKAICEAACGNPLAHFCSAEEIVRSLQVGVFTPYPSEDLWFSSGIRIDATTTVNDCDGWQCGQSGFMACSTEHGPLLQRQDRLINTLGCGSSVKLACCL